MHRYRFGICASLVALLAGALAGCAEKSPEERVAEIRSRYKADLNGFYVEETPLALAVDAAVAGEEAAAEAPEVEEVALKRDAHLDILVRHDSFEKLPGLTVDISMASADGGEKGHWRLWLDTAGIERANPTQFSHVLEDVPYEPGDGFMVEVRPVPADERGDYREFAAAPQ